MMDIQQILEPLSFDKWIDDYWGQRPFYNAYNRAKVSRLISVDTIHQSAIPAVITFPADKTENSVGRA